MAKEKLSKEEKKAKKAAKSKEEKPSQTAAENGGSKGAADAQAKEEKERFKWQNLCAIAKPLASKKLNKKALLLVSKAAKNKGQLKRGVKEVVKSLKKGLRGVCILAGDISPIDVISHLPILCEEASVPYVYVPSREDLGHAGATKRPTSVVLILPTPPKGDVEVTEDFKSTYEEVKGELQALSTTVFA